MEKYERILEWKAELQQKIKELSRPHKELISRRDYLIVKKEIIELARRNNYRSDPRFNEPEFSSQYLNPVEEEISRLDSEIATSKPPTKEIDQLKSIVRAIDQWLKEEGIN